MILQLRTAYGWFFVAGFVGAVGGLARQAGAVSPGALLRLGFCALAALAPPLALKFGKRLGSWHWSGTLSTRAVLAVDRICRVLLAMAVGTISGLACRQADAPSARLSRLSLGILAAGLVVTAAALGLRRFRHPWVKQLPLRWLQQNHIATSGLAAWLTACHVGRLGPLGSRWSWALVICFMLICISGAIAWLFKKLRPTATVVEQNIKVSQGDKATLLSQKQKDALAGSQLIVETQDRHLEHHRALTLAFLVLLAGHVLFHLYY